MITEEEVEHLQQLLEQEAYWVRRARWPRWLRTGAEEDTTAIEVMGHDDRLAACAWLRQQQHYLHETIHGGPAPAGWVDELPLHRALRVD